MRTGKRSRSALGVALAAAMLLTGWQACAQVQTFPQRTVRIIVGFPVGSSPDVVARLVGEEVGKSWGQSVVVENRPGAGAIIATEQAAKAAPDGHTLYIATLGALGLNPHLYKTLPYDPAKDFAGVAFVAENPFALAVHPSVPANTIPELIAYAKANPAKVNFGSGASFAQMLGDAFNRRAGTQIANVSYKGVQQAVTDFLSGQVQLIFADLPSILPQHKAGKAKILGITAAKRSPIAPDLPVMGEVGVKGMELPTWYAFVAPVATPQPVLARLNADLSRVMAQPDIRKRFEGLGLENRPMTPAQVNELIRAEIAKWGVIVREAGIQPQ